MLRSENHTLKLRHLAVHTVDTSVQFFQVLLQLNVDQARSVLPCQPLMILSRLNVLAETLRLLNHFVHLNLKQA